LAVIGFLGMVDTVIMVDDTVIRDPNTIFSGRR
jgi:hypothetical protein